MGRKWRWTLLVTAAVIAVGLVTTLAVNGLPGTGSSRTSSDNTQSEPSEAGSTPPPAGPERTGPEPRTVPAVRDWKAQRGTGWKPQPGARVVTDRKGPLADEADLLAEELKLDTAGGKPRAGDVELRLTPEAKTGAEGYRLRTADGRVRITGAKQAGVFYGTRTLLQAVRNQELIADGEVRDRPDRPQRGFLLDIARKNYSADWIESRIKEMGDLKLNQLQLHFSDDQAYRIASDSHPEIVSDPHLTKKQVRHLVDVAASRHIEVVPELDSPGHLGTVLDEHPDLAVRSASGEVARGAIDIGKPKAGKLVDDLLREIDDLFPAKQWHLGGDEYPPLLSDDPESSYPGLASVARDRYGDDAKIQDLATAWINHRADTVRKLKRMPQVWNDGMHAGGVVKPNRPRTVNYWTGKEMGAREPADYFEEKWNVVNLNDEYLYYVLGEPNDFTYPTGERIYREWTPAVVRHDKAVPDRWAGRDRILGARFAVWGDISDAQTTEQVANGIRLPLAATAQKVWDPREPRLSWKEFSEAVPEQQ
ncbi:family 20 glycosylhydrolase [Streptomyces xiaopingdaonensis]|uniref:family 20 glycosylhydrolase n=1 Tax=Streptomyces xiaopingdaonensis TaxID=1565415 RepID=UPI0002E46686|nr:family 20 glycosylhydrolase [Streptomyces xiaopingdaonensis]